MFQWEAIAPYPSPSATPIDDEFQENGVNAFPSLPPSSPQTDDCVFSPFFRTSKMTSKEQKCVQLGQC